MSMDADRGIKTCDVFGATFYETGVTFPTEARYTGEWLSQQLPWFLKENVQMSAVSCDTNENNLTQPFVGRHTGTRGRDILHASRTLKILCWQINGHSRRWVVGWKEVPFICETLLLYENVQQPFAPVPALRIAADTIGMERLMLD